MTGSGKPQAKVWVLALVAGLVIAPVYGPRLAALFPLQQDVTAVNSTGDDWLTYHQFAVSVLEGGWTIPAVQGNYHRPGGFGYVYFVALSYAVFGVRSEAVYLLQGLLLVAAVILMALTFGRRLSTWPALLLTVSLAVFMSVDMFRYLTFRLLSENLLVPLLAALLWLVLKGESTARLPWWIAAGLVCGFCALTRLNVVFFGPTIAAVIAVYPWHQQRSRRWGAATAFLAAFALVASIMPARNLAVTGGLGVREALSPTLWNLPPAVGEDAPVGQRLSNAAWYYGKKTAFALGVTTWLEPAYRVRPHWLLMWGGVAFYLMDRRRREFWEVLLLTLTVVYLVPIVAVAGISNYGVRMVAPVVPLVLPLAVRGAEVAAARFAKLAADA